MLISLLWPITYLAETTVVVDSKTTDPVSGTPISAEMLPSTIATQVDVIVSHNVARKAVDALHLTSDPVWRSRYDRAKHGSDVIDDAKRRAAATYNAAADYFDAPALRFWDRLGRRTVERLSLRRGATVLDACCGSGASAIPAAEAVGLNGRVLGVDLAENLLILARAKAECRGLAQTEFRAADIEGA